MKNNVLVIALLALIAGLFLGYTLTPRTMMNTEFAEEMHEEKEEHMEYGEEIIDNDGMMQHAMEEMMLGFRGKTGEEYEKAFLEMMIVHHIGAIEMAEELLEQTDRPELVQMANDIITVQNQEVQMMKGWLSDWFNS